MNKYLNYIYYTKKNVIGGIYNIKERKENAKI